MQTMKRKTNKTARAAERIYAVTLADGSKREFAGTHVEKTRTYIIIWNESIAVGGFERSEYIDIRLLTSK